MKKLVFITLFAALFFTACEKEPTYESYNICCNVLKNNSGHDLKITLVREDTTVYYHLADNDSSILDNEKNYLFDDAPCMNHSVYWCTGPYWHPNSMVERTAICTFDDIYSHVSREIYYYDSIGELEQIVCIPEDWNFFHSPEPLFDYHNYIQNDTFFHQVIITPAYYDCAVEQSGASQK